MSLLLLLPKRDSWICHNTIELLIHSLHFTVLWSPSYWQRILKRTKVLWEHMRWDGIVFTSSKKLRVSVWGSPMVYGTLEWTGYWHSSPPLSSFCFRNTNKHTHSHTAVNPVLTSFGKTGSFLPGWTSFVVIQCTAASVARSEVENESIKAALFTLRVDVNSTPALYWTNVSPAFLYLLSLEYNPTSFQLGI